ncbi:MAG TPA: nucleotidyltransferase family protein [Pseudobdellovibrionaceae bacterium]|nr:nucleotidyltransferase family protein [Pseudobdellovibrionaceae bacterium]
MNFTSPWTELLDADVTSRWPWADAEPEHRITAQIRSQGLAAWAFRHAPLDSNWKREFLPDTRKLAERNLILIALSRSLEELWKLAGLRAVRLKGIDLIQRSEGKDLGATLRDARMWRPLSDLDYLFVDRVDLEEARQALRSRGWQMHLPESAGKEVWLLKTAGQEVALELHTKLIFNEPQEWRWSEWIEMSRDGRAYQLKLPALWIHLSGHWVVGHACQKYFWLLDLKMLGPMLSKSDWEQVSNLARQLSLRQACALSLACVQRLKSELTDQDVSSTGFQSELRSSKRTQLWSRLILLRPLRHRGFRSLGIRVSVRDRSLHAAQYVFYWIRSAMSRPRSRGEL